MKKKLFWILAVALAAILLCSAYFKLLPYWASTLSVVTFAVGAVAGWVAKILYDKYIKDDVVKG